MRFLLIFLGALSISACGAGGKETTSSGFEQKCISDGNSAENCACTAEAMKSSLGDEAFFAIQEFAVSGDIDGGEEYFQQLFTNSPKKMLAFSESVSKCSDL